MLHGRVLGGTALKDRILFFDISFNLTVLQPARSPDRKAHIPLSQVPQEKEDLHSRGSWLETQLLQLLNDTLTLQGQCDALTARVKFLEDSMANSTALSIPKIVSASKKRLRDALPKA